jgi:hypothetical protein
MSMSDRPVLLPGTVLDWNGLKMDRDREEDCFRACSGDFIWEVDASKDADDGQYRARVLYGGLKIVSGQGFTPYAALSDAVTNASTLEARIATEVLRRKGASRGRQTRTTRYT